jgi:hypothetical protein
MGSRSSSSWINRMATTPSQLIELENQLNHFDPAVRSGSLVELCTLADHGEIPLAPEHEVANMHCHTFFSFNAYGYSPSGLAWLAKRRGIKLMAIVDFDVLDGTDEFLNACDQVGVRGASEMETRVFFPEFSTRETNSPGEPGIYYHMGIGFSSSQAPDSANTLLQDMRQRSRCRNLEMIRKLNEYLSPAAIDYERDVLPLTPAGNATERHMLVAYLRAAEKTVQDLDDFWASRLKSAPEQIAKIRMDPPAFQNLVRSKLMKRGGVAYTQPGHNSFPSVEEFHSMVEACGAIVCATWLDGLSNGEQCMEEELETLTNKGASALNIVPDRNWNVADPELRRIKLQNLYAVVQLARQFDLPLNVGTEMNTPGNKLIDDFDVPELEPVREAFLDGAYFIYGHTVLQRSLGSGYQSEWAKKFLPSRREKNAFFTQVGKLIPPGRAGQNVLKQLPPGYTPAEILRDLQAR